MAAHPMMKPMHGLYGRDRYQGEFLPAVVEVREPVRVVSMRRSGDCLLIAINDAGNVRLIRVSRLDSPGLELLSALDRANAQSALAAMRQEGGDAA